MPKWPSNGRIKMRLIFEVRARILDFISACNQRHFNFHVRMRALQSDGLGDSLGLQDTYAFLSIRIRSTWKGTLCNFRSRNRALPFRTTVPFGRTFRQRGEISVRGLFH